MTELTTSKRSEYRTELEKFRREYLRGQKNFADDTVEYFYKPIRQMWRYIKTERWGIPEEEYVDILSKSVEEDSEYSAEEICELTKRGIAEKLKETKWGVINADRCIEYEENHQDRPRILRMFRQKKNAKDKIDCVEVTQEDIKRLTEEDVRAYFRDYIRDEKELKRSTAQGYLTAFSHFQKWYSHDKLAGYRDPIDLELTEDIVGNISQSTEDSAGVLEVEECRKLLRSLKDPKYEAMVMTLLKTGMRRSDIVNIKIKDVDFENKYIRVEDRKNDHNTNVLIDSEVVTSLKTYLMTKFHDDPDDWLFTHGNGEKYDKSTISSRVRRLATEAGLKIKTTDSGRETSKVTPHWLRATFANHYYNPEDGTAEGDMTALKMQMGHELGTTQTYVNPNNSGSLSRKQRRRDFQRSVVRYLS